MLCTCFAWELPAIGQATLVADAHVNAALPTMNSGSISNVEVGGGYTGLWEFNLGLLPTGTTASQVARAVLILYPNRVDASGSLLLSSLDSAWTETAVTATTMPAAISSGLAVNVEEAGSFVVVDVTDLVKGWIASPTRNFGFALTSTSAVVQFDSKENDLTSHPASLELTLVSAGPAGPSGLVGPMGPAGANGANGANGVKGANGSDGSTGSIGPMGAVGAAGPIGLTGPAGTAGVAGTAGALGSIGPAGSQGPAGPAGPAGLAGSQGSPGPSGNAGASGPAGPPGLAGLPGLAGPQGIPGAIGSAGSAGLMGTPGTPGPQGVAGAPGTAGPIGSQGLSGTPGASGPLGATGPQGNTGQSGETGQTGVPGITFRGTWTGSNAYAISDAVAFGGSTYISTAANSNVSPDQNGSLWTLLAASGTTGPTGPTGALGSAATLQIGQVRTGSAGTSASVVNVGTSSAAVLNFSIPQGAVGASGGGTGSGSGAPTLSGAGSMVHGVSYAASFYSLSNPNQSLQEASSVLTWVPAGCTATGLNVFSLQGGTITVTVRVGSPQAMLDSALSCQVTAGNSCSSAGSVVIPAGGFVDFSVSHSDSTPASVWTALTCS